MAKSIKPSSNSSDTNDKKTASKSPNVDKASDISSHKTVVKKAVPAVVSKTKSQASIPVDAKKTIKPEEKKTSTNSTTKDKVEKKSTTVVASKKNSSNVTVQPQIKKKKFPASVVFGKPIAKKVEEKPKVVKENTAPTKKTQTTAVAKFNAPAPKAVDIRPVPTNKIVASPIDATKSANVAKKTVEVKTTPVKENSTKTKTVTVAPVETAKKSPVSSKTQITKTIATNTISGKFAKPTNKGDVRYSDEDLAIFKQVIDQQKSEIIEEINSLNERIEAFNNRDFTEESTYSLHMAEQTGDAIEAERARNRISDLTELVKKLNDAIIRIDNKTYGICRICNCLIAKERLLVVPVTTLSASYKLHGKCPEDGIDRTEKSK